MIRFLDEASWPRTQHCEVFRHSLQPMYCVTFPLEIKEFLGRIKKEGHPFSLSLIHLVARCANQIPAFRCRFVDGRPAEHSLIHTSYTYLAPGEELFKVIRVPFADDLTEYLRLAQTTQQVQTECFTGPLGNDVFQFSALPWLPYTAISHTIPGKPDQAVPIISWGKYEHRDGKTFLPFSVQAHHSFVDGIHIARLAELLKQELGA